jgi:hypothetical protein
MVLFLLLHGAMTSDAPQNPAGDDHDVWAAITAFEQILETIPSDTASLSVLAQAYAQIGDHARATEHLLRLGKVFLDEKQTDAAVAVIDRLAPYQADERVRELVDEIAAAVAAAGGTPAAESSPTASVSAPAASAPTDDALRPTLTPSDSEMRSLSQFRISEELSLAWNLMESSELTQDEYTSVVQDLSEMSASDHSEATISVLHVLEARSFKSLDKIVGTLARDCGTPFVALACFEFQYQALSLLPVAFCTQRGAMAFETLGKDAMVAILNPYDTQLRLDVEYLSGRKCHFFVVLASDFDRLLARYRETAAHGGVPPAAKA